MNNIECKWQNGLCDVYAQALIDVYPHLRVGASGVTEDGNPENGWTPLHFFAHDGTYAYDSLGRHKLPYLGINDQFDYCEPCDIRDYWWDKDAYPYGENGNLSLYEEAVNQVKIDHPNLSP